jgi:thiol-disulfide isomerase/thioredoxin
MKTIFLFLLLIFNAATGKCQRSDSLKMPAVLLSSKAQKMELAFQRARNYDSDIGRYLGAFTAIDNDGKTITDSCLIGKVTFVDFWFDGCAPCHALFAPLNALYTKYESDSNFQVLSFTFDRKDFLKKNVEKYGLLYRNISVTEDLCRKLLGMHGFSCTYILDQNGKIVSGHSGHPQDGDDPYNKLFIPTIDSLLHNGLTGYQ